MSIRHETGDSQRFWPEPDHGGYIQQFKFRIDRYVIKWFYLILKIDGGAIYQYQIYFRMWNALGFDDVLYGGAPEIGKIIVCHLFFLGQKIIQFSIKPKDDMFILFDQFVWRATASLLN